MEIKNIIRPKSLDEAYRSMLDQGAYPIAGGTWIRLGSRVIETALDLSTLDLRYIRTEKGKIELGAMTTLRDVELSAVLEKSYGSLFKTVVGPIVGVPMRNLITVGGTVGGRYGFSDLNTLLLALNARVVLYKTGEMDFASYLEHKSSSPLLIEKILIDERGVRGAFTSIRKTKTDLAILNAAAAFTGTEWRLVLGARPGMAKLAKNAGALLGSTAQPSDGDIQRAADAAAQELDFGADIRGDEAYRSAVAPVLIRRAILEVRS
jgi:CO/xanthine dehydrogenase FAD-binding subunit